MLLINRIFCAVFAVTLLSWPIVTQAQAQMRAQAQGTNIAVVDVERILSDSMAGKSIQTQLSGRREAFQKEFGAREDTLMTAQRALIDQKQNISPDEFAQKRQNFEKQLSETRSLFQKRRNALDKGLGSALTELRKSIVKVTAAVADEGGFQIVLTRDSVIIVEAEMDITEKVLARLNSDTQVINLDVSE